MNPRPSFFYAADLGGNVRTPAPSLLQPAVDAQADFFAQLEVECAQRVKDHGQAGEFTGDRLFFDSPATYKAIVEALGAGKSAREIAAALKVSPNSVRKVREREGVSVDALRDKARKSAALFLADGWERARENVDNVPLAGLFVPLGIAADTLDKLSAGAAADVDVTDDTSLAEFEHFLMGLGGESPGQKGLADAAAAGQDRQAGQVPGPLCEIESPVLPGVSGADATAFATAAQAGAASVGAAGRPDPGGEGVALATPPAIKPIHSGESLPGLKDLSESGPVAGQRRQKKRGAGPAPSVSEKNGGAGAASPEPEITP